MQIKLENKQVGVLVALVLAVIMLFLPGSSETKYAFDPSDLSKQILGSEDQITPRQLSEMIIAGKGDYQLIDIRQERDYKKGNIKTSENIPLDRLLKKETIEVDLSRDKLVILYSNGNSHAHQAWLVLKTAGLDTVVLEGGFNGWVNNVLNPKLPKAYSDDEILKYNRAGSIANYFSGGSGIKETEVSEKTKARPVRKRSAGKKKLRGCGS